MIIAVHKLQEKCQEYNGDLYTTFVDLTKAFDTVSHDWLWWIMEKFGCSRKFISMVCQIFLAILSDAFCHNEETITMIKYRTNGRLFNLQRLQAKTKVEENSVCEFLLADDCALNTAQTQHSMNCFSTACRNHH
ncbi:hypothetical protein NDU88_007394 [Pleurodeles waltl]|uniref:Reverse transcriptase domain-containing protein n=1 Tax=Pleurodeles waltl TaxID=8319 RepID=A0AAV7N3L3_PLEWA|nr:hypothetical protein NDU88_007394 [Pleurodeles waltl]